MPATGSDCPAIIAGFSGNLAIYPCGFIKPDYVSDPQTSGPRNSSGLFSSGSKRADSGRINGEGRILFCTGARMSIFDSLVLDSWSQLFWRMPEQNRI